MSLYKKFDVEAALRHNRGGEPATEIDCAEDNTAVTARIAALDAARNAADRAAGRGYDYDKTAPSHEEFIERQSIPAATPAETLAHSLIKLCAEYKLRLHADPAGIVIEVVAGDWPAVMRAMEDAEYHHAI